MKNGTLRFLHDVDVEAIEIHRSLAPVLMNDHFSGEPYKGAGVLGVGGHCKHTGSSRGILAFRTSKT